MQPLIGGSKVEFVSLSQISKPMRGGVIHFGIGPFPRQRASNRGLVSAAGGARSANVLLGLSGLFLDGLYVISKFLFEAYSL